MPVQNIEDRLMEYALRSIKLFRFLHRKRDGVSPVLAKQFLRSSTSIGANMTEAQSGESKADFIHKCSIAQKEAKESRYWLKLMVKAEILPTAKLTPLLQETEELVAIITTIITKTKANMNPPLL